MYDKLIDQIRSYAPTHSRSKIFPLATRELVAHAEKSLQFPFPELLQRCYLEIGNGGFGPGWGVIGLEGGCASDYGDVVGTFMLLKSDQESEGNTWKKGLLPFCGWGCNIFSCVDCLDTRHPVYTFEDFAVAEQGYLLPTFFELWMNGEDILSRGRGVAVAHEITNPFTGKKAKVFRRNGAK